MKTFCEVCTANPATLVCCADDAVMCGSCDQSIHSANAVVAKHERVAFSANARPMCDICQAAPVVVVCHEDRAFLCRGCDTSIHSANEFVAKHRRFLFSGVGLALESVGAKQTHGGQKQTDDVPPRALTVEKQLAHVNAPAPANTVPKTSKGKRKASALQQSSHESEDALVPSLAGPSSSGGSGAAQAPLPDDEFNSFVADFVKGGAAADADFLDTFFDDIPAGFREEDFGVVPTFR